MPNGSTSPRWPHRASATEGSGGPVADRDGLLDLAGEPSRIDDLSAGADRIHDVRQHTGELPSNGARTTNRELGEQSARVRRETYIGPWLPEPVDTSADPYLGAERGEALEFAALLLMEKLTPNERAAYVLREAFDYPYAQVADILQSTEPAVRQLVSRARKHVTGERRTPASADAQRELLTSFIAAARTGDMTALERLFAADVASLSDGNGATRVSRRPVVGAQRVAKYITAISTWFWEGMQVQWVNANGQTSAVLRRDGKVFGVLTVTASTDGIDHLLWMVNPAKITAVIEQA